MVQLVSAVGGGRLKHELNLSELSADLEAAEIQFDKSHYHGIIARFTADGPAVLIYRSGSFSISGAETLAELHEVHELFENRMKSTIGPFEYKVPFEVRNLVFRSEIPTQEETGKLNLSLLAIGLGANQVEYEPEQFPGLLYRPTDTDGLYLIFASGKMVSTGHSDQELARASIKKVTEEITEVIGSK